MRTESLLEKKFLVSLSRNGARLKYYPKGCRLFRCSSNMTKPKVEKKPYLLALRENVKGYEQVFARTTNVLVENEDKSKSIIQAWSYEQYNVKRKEKKKDN